MLSGEKGEFIFQDGAFEDELRVILEQIKTLKPSHEEQLMNLIKKVRKYTGKLKIRKNIQKFGR